MEARAVARYVRMSPHKVRRVAELVKGKSAEEALNVLHFVHKAAATPLGKAVRSAASNAAVKKGSSIDFEDLVVKGILVDQGPTLKRMIPRARGIPNRILKRTCHITVIVSETE